MNLRPQRLRPFATAFGLAITLLASSSLAQTDMHATPAATAPCKSSVSSTGTPAKPCRAKRRIETSLSLGVGAQLTIDRTHYSYDSITAQSTAPSTATLGTFRQTFSPWLGYSVNLGYSRVSEQYLNSQISGIYGGLESYKADTNMYETSITYIAHTNLSQRISLFGDGGPGLLTFLPVERGPNAVAYAPYQSDARGLSVQVRPAGVFGSGIDIHLSRHLALRAEYRGLLYSNPDFRTGDYLSKQITLTSEPTFSLVYNFHPRKP